MTRSLPLAGLAGVMTVLLFCGAGAAADPLRGVQIAYGGGGAGGGGGGYFGPNGVTPENAKPQAAPAPAGSPPGGGATMAPPPRRAEAAESGHVRLALVGAGCLCDLPLRLAARLGTYRRAGLDVEFVRVEDGHAALAAALEGRADVAAADYSLGVELAAQKKPVEAFVAYDRLPGFVLVVAPKASAAVKSIADLAGRTVGVAAPGSASDLFLRYLLAKGGVDPATVRVVGIGLDVTAAAPVAQGEVDAAVMLDPAVTLLAAKYRDLRLLADTRSERGAQAVFGAAYPGGALQAPHRWVAEHPRTAQALADAVILALSWMDRRDPGEILAEASEDGGGLDGALYRAALENTLPIYSRSGLIDVASARAVLAVLSRTVPQVANAPIDLAATYTNEFAARADAKLGVADAQR
jgi:NitT/TauT family transport system substrate-binding protein